MRNFERRRSGSNEMVCEVRRPDPRARAAIPEEKVRDMAFGAIATLLSDGRVPALVDATSDSKILGPMPTHGIGDNSSTTYVEH